MKLSTSTLAVVALGFLGSAQANKVVFCVREGGNEDEGYGPFEKEKTHVTKVEDLTKEWDDQGFQVKQPDRKAHVHGIDGRLNNRCQLVYASTGERKKLTMCYREEGNTGKFLVDRAPVEQFSQEYMAKYYDRNAQVQWEGDKVTVNGEKKWLSEGCKGLDARVAPSVYGDPHFTTWGGDTFDFHGACDLVMVENPHFADGLGLRVHIRTALDNSRSWSYIESAVVQIGQDTLQVMGSRDGAPKYWINAGEDMEVQDGETLLGDFPVLTKRIKDSQARVRLDVGNGNAIAFETYKQFVRVNIGTQQKDYFYGTTGILGSFGLGEMHARDGKTIIADPVEFGNEWQVNSSEHMLFKEASATQFPNKCVMPDHAAVTESRRLGEGISEEDAYLACARVGGDSRDACIFDVLATNDKDMAGSY